MCQYFRVSPSREQLEVTSALYPSSSIDLPPLVGNMAEKTTYEIYGYHHCSYANSAVSKANQVQSKHPDTVTVKTQITSRSEFKQWLSQNMNRVGQHRTSPACFANDKFIGGCDDFSAHLDTKYPGEQSGSFCMAQ